MSLLACAGCRLAVGRSLPPRFDAKHAGDFVEGCLLGANLNTSAKQASRLLMQPHLSFD